MATIHTCPECGSSAPLRPDHACDECGRMMAMRAEQFISYGAQQFEVCSERCAEAVLLKWATRLREKNPEGDVEAMKLWEHYRHILGAPWRCAVCYKESRPPHEGGTAGFALVTPGTFCANASQRAPVPDTDDNQAAVELLIVSGIGHTRVCSYGCLAVLARNGEREQRKKAALDRIEREFADYAKATWWQYAWRRLLYRLRLIFTT